MISFIISSDHSPLPILSLVDSFNMCTNFCGFRKRLRPNEADLNCGLTASVTKMLKPRSIWTSMTAKKRQLCPPEKVSLTLEDLILSSPAFSSGGESMPVHKQSSKKIHPSINGDLKLELLPQSGFCVVSRDEAKEGEEVTSERANTSFCRTKSVKEMKKKKKKVSFRSPEVADVFVLDYPPEM